MSRGARSVVPALLLVLLGSACGGEPPQDRPDGRLVLVSGRDDHGELAMEQVPLYTDVEQAEVSGAVEDGTLAQVLEIEGQMLRVVAVEGETATGWVDDYFLRGAMHLVGDGADCRASLGGEVQQAGLLVEVRAVRNGQLLVQSVADAAVRGWTPRETLQELSPRGSDCSGEPSGGHQH